MRDSILFMKINNERGEMMMHAGCGGTVGGFNAGCGGTTEIN
jgi:hypothetical protein